ncbi:MULTISPECIES: L-lactate dehydrogenase [Ramlibacter]|uniref:L-lactate dehydrogenase n=1 Tax=Ramlibacter pinisoli TaxID=2682844 RepID=A0A6N8IYB2_9BURK|nr:MULTISPECIES: L-lactate dehydrogenase [Ramlibacter]MBA2961028.1 L-lactate dehydrogenase [Ramlibacter sp. CGMCC 1.13660]MVQ30973.1 L-lactate dehydrogenase [Ramlibacter pinisoli]
MQDTKIAIIGAGRVGSTFAYTLATSGLAREIVLIDADSARAEGEAMDIAHAVPFHRPVVVRPGAIDDAQGALVTVLTAGAAQRPGEARTALFQRNVEMLRDVLQGVMDVNPEGLFLMTTNPVDALTYVALRLTGLPPGRVFGSGTVLDSARLRAELAGHCAVDARNVHAYVLGEHGDSEFVAWSTASLGNVPIPDYCSLAGMVFSRTEMDAIEQRVRRAAYEIIQRKGATNFAIATSLTRIVEAIVRDDASVLTVSTLLHGEYGISDVCLSLPAIVGRHGVTRTLPVSLAPEELSAMQRSAEAIRGVIADVADLPPAIPPSLPA